MSDLDTMQQRVGEWANRTFPESNTHTILAHLRDEIGELTAAETDAPLARELHQEEAADCLLLLLHYAHRRRFSLFDAAVGKAAINEQRQWQTVKNDRGYFSHIETERQNAARGETA